MPTYVVAAAEGRLDAQLKHAIASGITQAHSEATGAQAFFAQVIFQDIAAGNHFLAGQPVKSDHIFVHGEIRAGRTSEQKQRLLERILGIVVDEACTPSRHVWVYLSELPPSQMVEFGRVLPEPGCEAQWLEGMSGEDRRFLDALG
ncbi:phenylpyruvate tautomerase PptA (4-oxalocrotonate tautomerase family) [Paraburkholderia sp. BL18I3N2]|uniref:tautomerase family protein n=1 Tax=Paraburkholderia sp. BL18I3N2 TaxID=1938799 RepID=UPI000D061107|nr:tautomerase family protein [Paraburkholderia sp. BL18I3N2]PRX24170.1 phenylpyruvate tautomerase PptA (4-oxalocrotonate tautomerase family) [Paraburkholderia sp. BL18I3N2]